jgi:hypothetical protein
MNIQFGLKTGCDNTAPSPESSGAAGLGVSGLYMSGFSGFPPPPINWRRVGDEAESVCSRVAITERLLHETLVSVIQNILHLIRVSLKKRGKSCPRASGFLHAPSSPPVFCLYSFHPREVRTCLRCWRRCPWRGRQPPLWRPPMSWWYLL